VQPDHILRLYIAGTSSRSTQAIKNVREICRTHLGVGDVLQIVDLYQQPALAAADAVIAAPTLIRKHPQPERRLTGDMCRPQEIVNLLADAGGAKQRAGSSA
jgi:hypothetical protein